MKSKILTTYHIGLSLFLLSYTILLLSCSGGTSGKVQHSGTLENITDSAQKQIPANIQDSTSSTQQEASRHDAVFESISLSNLNDHRVNIKTDEYNVYEHILSFYDKETRKLIKKVDLVKENPFHKMGLERRKEPYPALYYFLMPEGKDTKQALKKFLPQEVYHEIPHDFEMDRAISKIFVSMTAGKYVTISYELDWLPDAYSDQGEWDGPGYGVHYVVVYDSLGNKIYTRQFDGTSVRPSVSEDGKYLFTMACISPEWDENIRYRFTVVNIQTDKVVYEELIENCKKHGGSGNFYVVENNKNLKCSPYKIQKLDRKSKRYLYYENKFYIQKEYQLIYTWFLLPNRQIDVVFLGKPSEIINIDSFFNEVKLD